MCKKEYVPLKKIVRTCQKSKTQVSTAINSPHIKHGTVTENHY